MVNRLFDHLVLTDREGGFVPGRLLSRWEASPDGLRWDFHLRPDARWHDGRPVTARDACCTLEAMLDPATRSPRRSEFLVDGEPIAFAAVSPRVLRIELPAPFAPFLASLAWRPVIPEGSHEDVAPVGSGAFALAGWEPGARVTMRAHDAYHLGRPPLDEVEWRRYDDAGAATEALLAGEVDYVPGVPPELIETVEAEPDARIVRSLDGSFTSLGFHLDHGPFRDVRVRRAIGAAIDREAIVREVLRGEGQVAHGPVVPSSRWYNNPELSRLEHDPRLAVQLLDAAGRPRLDFTISTVANDRVKLGAARRIVADLARVGVTARVEAHDMGTLLERHAFPGGFQALLLGLTPGLDPTFLHACYHGAMRPPGGWNLLGYADPRVDGLLAESQRALDAARRRELVAEAQARIADDVPHVPLFHAAAVDAARTRLALPELPPTPANRFMFLHQWDVVQVPIPSP